MGAEKNAHWGIQLTHTRKVHLETATIHARDNQPTAKSFYNPDIPNFPFPVQAEETKKGRGMPDMNKY